MSKYIKTSECWLKHLCQASKPGTKRSNVLMTLHPWQDLTKCTCCSAQPCRLVVTGGVGGLEWDSPRQAAWQRCRFTITPNKEVWRSEPGPSSPVQKRYTINSSAKSWSHMFINTYTHPPLTSSGTLCSHCGDTFMLSLTAWAKSSTTATPTMHVSRCRNMNGTRRRSPRHWLVLQGSIRTATPAVVRCFQSRHSPQQFSCKSAIHIPSLPVHQLSNWHTHAHTHARMLIKTPGLSQMKPLWLDISGGRNSNCEPIR